MVKLFKKGPLFHRGVVEAKLVALKTPRAKDDDMRTAIMALLMVALLAGFAPGAGAFEIIHTPDGDVVAGRALVFADADIPAARLNDNLTRHGFVLARVSTTTGKRLPVAAWTSAAVRRPEQEAYLLVEFDPQRDVLATLSELEAIDGVAEAWPDHVRYASFTPNDPLFQAEQQNLRQIGLERAWNLTFGKGVIVAVLDTGYLLDGLDDGAERLLDGYDFGENDDDPNDTESHGTHVSNVIAEATDNGLGAAGAAPEVKLLPVKVFPDNSGAAAESDIVDGLYWAVDQGAQVANLSLGGGGYNSAGNGAVTYAVEHGVLVAVATGNDGGEVQYPAAYTDSLAVGSCDIHPTGDLPTRSDFSNFGDAIDLVAPGERVLAETFGGQGVGYYVAWGTSVAAPHVSAVAALLFASNDGIDVDDVREAMEENANRKPGDDWDVEIGWGEVDAYSAIIALGGQIPNDPPTASIFADPTEGSAPLTVAFTAGATDTDGNIDRYLWSFSSGETYNNVNFEHTFAEPGEYSILLTVTDSEGASGSDQVFIQVTQGKDDDDEKDDGGGCGCHAGGGGNSAGLFILLFFLPVLAWRRHAPAKTTAI